MSQQTPAREYAQGLFNALSKDRYLTDYESNLIERALIKYAEGECARLTQALQSIANNTCCERCQEAAHVARAALAKEPKP